MKKKITVIGDVMIDWYLHGESSRISPEAPVPVVNFKESKFQLGGAANVANNLKHLEIEPFLIGAVGKDHFGSLLKEHLKVEKIKFNLLSEKSFQTICKQRLMSSNQQLARIDYEQYFHASKLSNILNTFTKNIAKTDLIIVSDYGKGTVSNARKLIQSARKLKKKILIDPKGKDFTKYKGANLITPNKSEFENIMGKVLSKKDLENSKLDLVVAGTKDAVLMVESEANGLTEQQMLDAVKFGHEGFVPVIKMIEDLAKECKKPDWVVEKKDLSSVKKKLEG